MCDHPPFKSQKRPPGVPLENIEKFWLNHAVTLGCGDYTPESIGVDLALRAFELAPPEVYVIVMARGPTAIPVLSC